MFHEKTTRKIINSRLMWYLETNNLISNYIYNLCIQTSTFLDDFKIASIKSLFKGAGCKILSNYRSISMLTKRLLFS